MPEKFLHSEKNYYAASSNILVMLEKPIRWEQRFQSFSRALQRLKRYIDRAETLDDLYFEGMVKSFEFTYEMAWNTMKDFLESYGQTNIYGSRSAIKSALRFRLIDNGDLWSQMVDERNDTVHSYSEEMVERIVGNIRLHYFSLFQQFQQTMEMIREGQIPFIILKIEA